MALNVGVLALQGDVQEHRNHLLASGVGAPLIRRNSELQNVDALVIPGGESTTIDKLLKIFELRVPLINLINEGLPVYGSCAGMILLAKNLLDGTADQETLQAMDITVRRNAFGRQVESFDTEVEFKGIDSGPVAASFIRAPWVESVGQNVDVLAQLDHKVGSGRIVAVRQNKLLATSFHPEITSDIRVHQYFISMIGE